MQNLVVQMRCSTDGNIINVFQSNVNCQNNKLGYGSKVAKSNKKTRTIEMGRNQRPSVQKADADD